MILLYFAIGELMIQFIQREVIFNKLISLLKINFFKELIQCRKCLGFWVFLVLAFILNINFVEAAEYFGFVVTAVFTTYITYYASEGIKGNHQIVVVGTNGKQ